MAIFFKKSRILSDLTRDRGEKEKTIQINVLPF